MHRALSPDTRSCAHALLFIGYFEHVHSWRAPQTLSCMTILLKFLWIILDQRAEDHTILADLLDEIPDVMFHGHPTILHLLHGHSCLSRKYRHKV